MADEETVKMPHRTVADGYNDRPTTAPSPADTTKTTSIKIGKTKKPIQKVNPAGSIAAAVVAIVALAGIVSLYIFTDHPSGGAVFALFLIGLCAAASI